ncbi:sulfonate transport system substrate-binding protein [Dysgonomonas alginatilytica]|uniref:Putative aliphatic sulfonates-binding protein n=1 Tax=Dysgonomonas alginatilytica TaxID=1605892 RepID=A0A2V3PK00_9BACT|nr:aliphatic sulfonate ABC transporter substrate-binding protein [Dysgonomonas alginatilytica]PXV58932.1 sulfonate transport system substrate-binding protein [Dysgonomonas alginatilytica]
MDTRKKNFIIAGTLVFIALVVLIALPSKKQEGDTSEEKITEIILDYANWSPISLVLKNQGFLEEELKKNNISVRWVFSQGSNKSMELLRSKSIDIGSSAGVAALVSFVNGNPIETVYVSSTPEWTALVIPSDSKITDIKELKGKTIAATPGTDPYVFLVHTLSEAGLSLEDVKVVTLQHPDGKNELIRHRVDAWAGLDPLMAQVEYNRQAKFLYRNVYFNSYNVISVRKEFGKKHSELVTRVLAVYEKARQWAIDHPDEYLELIAKETKLEKPIAGLMLQRTGLGDNQLTEKQRENISKAGKALQEANLLDVNKSIDNAISELFNTTYFDKYLNNN